MKKMTNIPHNDKKFMKLYNRTEKYEDVCDQMEVEIGSYLSKVRKEGSATKVRSGSGASCAR